MPLCTCQTRWLIIFSNALFLPLFAIVELALGIIAACLMSYGPFLRRHDINEAPIATPSNMKLAVQKAKVKEKELDLQSNRTDSALDYYTETPKVERVRTVRVGQNTKLKSETSKNYGVPTGVKYDKYGQRLGFMEDSPIQYDKYGQRIEEKNKAAAVLGAENTAAARAPTAASSKNSDTKWLSSISDSNSGSMSPGRAISTIGSVSLPAPSVSSGSISSGSFSTDFSASTERSMPPQRPAAPATTFPQPPVSVFSASTRTGTSSTPSLPIQTSQSTAGSVRQLPPAQSALAQPSPQPSSSIGAGDFSSPTSALDASPRPSTSQSRNASPRPAPALSRGVSPQPGFAQGSMSPPSRPGTSQSHRSVQSNLRREASVIGSSNGRIGTGIRLADGQQPQNLGLGINIGNTRAVDGYKVNDPDRSKSSLAMDNAEQSSTSTGPSDAPQTESKIWDDQRFEELMNKELSGDGQAAIREKLGLKSPMPMYGSQDAKRRQDVMMGLR